jgi:hypothetical protein
MARYAVRLPPVGASSLAMHVNDNAGYLNARVVWTFFASRLAPTVERVRHEELLLASTFFGSQEWHCHTKRCSPTKKKGVRLWLFAMAKG